MQESESVWDAEQIFGCLCSSGWAVGACWASFEAVVDRMLKFCARGVGLGDGETQESEFFGADCSLRRCPSGMLNQ